MSDLRSEAPSPFLRTDKTHHLSLILTSFAILFVLGPTTTANTRKPSDGHIGNIGVFAFTCEVYLPIGCSRLYGRMVSDGASHRTAIYWIEPTPLREGTHFLRYGDFLVSRDAVRYRIDGPLDTKSFSFCGNAHDALLPQDSSATSVVRCALGILACIKNTENDTDTPLGVGRFFAESGRRSDSTLEILPSEADSRRRMLRTTGDVDQLNALPYGRRYSKITPDDGTVIWRAERAIDNHPLFAVTVRPMPDANQVAIDEVFDPNTLGTWNLVPEAYRIYWSLSHRHSSLTERAKVRNNATTLYDEMEAYLSMTDPVDVRRAIDRLRLKVALCTQDPPRVQRAAQAIVEGLRYDQTASPYIELLELGQIASEINEQHPDDAETWLQPLVSQAIEYAGEDLPQHLQRLVSPVVNNKWYTYGDLLLDEARRQERASAATIATLAEKLGTSQRAAVLLPSDPNEASPSVRRYLTQLDTTPPTGLLTLSDIRRILQQGLAEQYANAQEERMRAVIEGTVRSIRLCVGDGPFHGDADDLIKSIKRFADIYLRVRKISDPIEPILATLLALSFCDISTSEDHDLLRDQYQDFAADLESQINVLLIQYELTTLVSRDDVATTFAKQKHIFESYVEDALWPTFKFSWTANEQTRLTNKLKLRVEQIKALLDEMSDNVRYGGVDDRLKRRTLYEIARVAEHLTVSAAFLRRPGYVGVSTQYRGGHGFTAVIEGPFYEVGKRPKERFKAMKYFHLGHRLEDVVRAERDLATPPRHRAAQQTP